MIISFYFCFLEVYPLFFSSSFPHLSHPLPLFSLFHSSIHHLLLSFHFLSHSLSSALFSYLLPFFPPPSLFITSPLLPFFPPSPSFPLSSSIPHQLPIISSLSSPSSSSPHQLPSLLDLLLPLLSAVLAHTPSVCVEAMADAAHLLTHIVHTLQKVGVVGEQRGEREKEGERQCEGKKRGMKKGGECEWMQGEGEG